MHTYQTAGEGKSANDWLTEIHLKVADKTTYDQGSDTRVRTPKNPVGFLGTPT